MQRMPSNRSLAGKTCLKQPLLYKDHPETPVSPLRLALNSLSYAEKAPKFRLARQTGLEQSFLCRKAPKFQLLLARLASRSLSSIENAPISNSCRRDRPQTTSPT